MLVTRDFTRVAATDVSNATSWLDPNGKFHPITRTTKERSWVSHSDWALQHGKRMNEMFENGWMRVTFYGDVLSASNDLGVPLNWKQKSELVDLAIVNSRFNTVSYENGQDDFTIWERE